MQGILRLDADSANAKLLVNEDGTCVRSTDTEPPVAENPKRFMKAPCVVGRDGYDSGTHTWVVEVKRLCGGNEPFCLGVIGGSVNRKKEYKESPQTQVWALEESDGVYTAYTDPLTPLPRRETVTNFRITLDYEAGKLDFSNADNPGDLIYTFSGYPFNEMVYPYFWLGKCVEMCVK
ncbi:hypothetical protein NDU88_000042 [Pleurodeles waltl]|uniref:B30.2/SPRY domain-containing protein n=1 Tax=Pleurodeles waltl TaxID=8319 RepID=A0AAV7KN10_PLEWA|nr:hypothetical protein NDU88_000042 [Pleurodeles waltl]